MTQATNDVLAVNYKNLLDSYDERIAAKTAELDQVNLVIRELKDSKAKIEGLGETMSGIVSGKVVVPSKGKKLVKAARVAKPTKNGKKQTTRAFVLAFLKKSPKSSAEDILAGIAKEGWKTSGDNKLQVIRSTLQGMRTANEIEGIENNAEDKRQRVYRLVK